MATHRLLQFTDEEKAELEQLLRAPAKRYQMRELAEFRTLSTQKRFCRQSVNQDASLSKEKNTVKKQVNYKFYAGKCRVIILVYSLQPLKIFLEAITLFS